MSASTCPFCQSPNVVPNVEVLDSGGVSGVLTAHLGEAKPGSLWDPKALNAVLRADICCGCGRATLRVEDPSALWAAWQAMPKAP